MTKLSISPVCSFCKNSLSLSTACFQFLLHYIHEMGPDGRGCNVKLDRLVEPYDCEAVILLDSCSQPCKHIEP